MARNNFCKIYRIKIIIIIIQCCFFFCFCFFFFRTLVTYALQNQEEREEVGRSGSSKVNFSWAPSIFFTSYQQKKYYAQTVASKFSNVDNRFFSWQLGPNSSGSDRDHAPGNVTRWKGDEPNCVTMATGVIPWEDNSLQHVGFVTGKHGQKSQSPVTTTGK